MQFKPLLALAGLLGAAAVFINVPRAHADASDEILIAPKDPAAAAADGRLILLKAAQFDPLVSEPTAQISRFWKADVEPSAGVGSYIIQFHGPILPGWQRGLTDLGATILGYIPNNALLVSVDVERLPAIRRQEMVRWVGHYRNWYKIDPRLAHSVINGDAVTLDNAALGVPLRVVGYRDTDGPALQKLAYQQFSGLSASKGQVGSWKGRSADLGIGYSRLPDLLATLAANENVHFISYRYPNVPLNNDSVWVLQSNDTATGAAEGAANPGQYPNSGTFFRQGLLGQNQIVGNSDSGADRDMCFFRNSATNCPAGCLASQSVPVPGALTLTPGERKIIAYNILTDATDGDVNVCSNHGTHTVGTMIGDNLANIATGAGAVNHNSGDGMAPMAKMVFQDIGRQSVNQAECDVFTPPATHPCCLLYGIPANLVDLFSQAYGAGVRIHSNSWGSADNAYDDNASQIDTFIYNNRDMNIFFAAGNDGANGPNSSGSPSNNKNGVSVAWFDNLATNRNASSGIGPSADGRIKPEIGAPGTNTSSAGGDANLASNNCGTASLSGTSMATPAVAGAATLLRQYFNDGFYPTGAAVPANARNPSAALMKATLFSGARNVTGAAAQGAAADPQTGTGAAPNIRQGFGAVLLNEAVGFSSNEHALWTNYKTQLWDLRDAQGVSTGITQEYNIDVTAGTPLAITVSWSDPPGLVGAAVALVNNLNLIVTGPTGTVYHGNQFTASGTAHRLSTANAAGFDVLNNTEQFYLAAPTAGNYRIQVVGANVPGYSGNFMQGYGLAAVGNLSAVTTACTQAAATAVTATPNGANRIDLTWTAAAGATRYGIYRNNNPSSCGSDFQQIAQVGAVTAYSDLTVNGGYTYNYKVAAIMPCESPLSTTCGTGAATGNCTLKPTFAGSTGATGLNQATCGNTITWGSGSSNCPLGTGITYDIYRGTTPNFTPAAGNRIATCLTGGTYTDTSASLLSGNTFFYVVRAEDSTTANGGGCNGGNEDPNLVRYAATPYGVGTQAGGGTWTDGGGDTTALLGLNTPATGNNGTPWRYITTTTDAGAAHTGISGYRTSGPLTTDTYPALTCAEVSTPNLTTNATTASLTYWERHNSEWQWDGTMVEFSTNNGTSWATVPDPAPATDWGSLDQTTAPPVNQCAYTVGGQKGFTGPNPNPAAPGAYAQRTHALVGLTAGGTVKLRWRLSSDPALNFQGLYLDDIALTNIRLPNACTPGGACSAPSGFSAPTAADASACLASGITVSWTAPANWGGTAGTYVVLRDTVVIATGTCSGSFPAATLTCLDSTAPAGPHTYQVRATNGCASSTTSSASSSATDASDTTAPGDPSHLIAKATPNMNFSWAAVATATNYTNYRTTTPAVPASWASQNVTATLAWVNAADLGTGTSYFYSTTAMDACLNESPK